MQLQSPVARRSPYFRQLNPERLSAVYEPYLYQVPNIGVPLASRAVFESRLPLPPGSEILGWSGYSSHASGFQFQLIGHGKVFNRRIPANVLAPPFATGIGPLSADQASRVFYLPQPYFVVAGENLCACVENLASAANTVALILHCRIPVSPVNAARHSAAAARPRHSSKTQEAAVQRLVIDLNTAGTHTLITPGTGQQIKIVELMVWNVSAQTIEFLDDAGRVFRLTNFTNTAGFSQEYSRDFEIPPGSPLKLSLSAATQVDGYIRYRLVEEAQ